jgi:hypothetical protein
LTLAMCSPSFQVLPERYPLGRTNDVLAVSGSLVARLRFQNAVARHRKEHDVP